MYPLNIFAMFFAALASVVFLCSLNDVTLCLFMAVGALVNGWVGTHE